MLAQHNQNRSFGGADGAMSSLNNSQQSSQSHQGFQRPSIYTALYSGVSVYEMEVNKVAVMRRRSDSWLNATQILKVAGIEKGKRTKVLEKEILVGEHEKVQGGYGKYQGTWINYQRSVEFCRQYGVEELLRPLLEYDMGQDGVSVAGAGGVETPTKEQAMAAQRKKLYNMGSDNRASSGSTNGTFFKNISSTASNAVAAINKARFESPAPRHQGNDIRRPGSIKRQSSSQQQLSHMASQDSSFPAGSQQSMMSLASESSFDGGVRGLDGQMDSTYGTQSGGTNLYANQGSIYDLNGGPVGDMHEDQRPRKRIRPSPGIEHQQRPSRHASFSYDTSMRDGTPTADTEVDESSFAYPNHSHASFQREQSRFDFVDDHTQGMALPPLPAPTGKQGDQKLQLLLSLFVDQTRTDFTNHEALLRLSGPDLDLPLDATEHTALHWAATLACMPLLKALIARGASIYRVNGGGETALIRACVVTNNLDQGSFPDLLEMLGPTIEMRDGRARTVLHHIAVSSAVKGRSGASRYYLESLLEFVVRQGSGPNSQVNSFNAGGRDCPATIGLGRFMSEIVNAQDNAGDTALNAAARIGNRSIIQQLLEVGADASIPNRSGLKPSDFGVGIPPAIVAGTHENVDFRTPTKPSSSHVIITPGRHDGAPTRSAGESSQEILDSMSSLLAQSSTQHQTTLSSLQYQIASTHASLRSTSAALATQKSTLEALHGRAAARTIRRQKIENLRRFTQAQLNGDRSDSLYSSMDDEMDDTLPFLSQSVPVDRSHQDMQPALSFAAPTRARLEARLRAYRINNVSLTNKAKELSSCSSTLESTYRRVVALCTGVKEDEVEHVLDGLVAAISGEDDNNANANDNHGPETVGDADGMEDINEQMETERDMGRLRAFLQRVEG